ncbi:MAG: hypothetical protein LBI13_04970 [Streptococcaceae bacterium]|jgi:hypothetical protein|nr:hypothetical protein [Streptococcaceae bacterium]
MKLEQIEVLKKYIISGNFKEARKVAKTFVLATLGTQLLEMSFDTQDVAIYFFLQDWLSDEESAELHNITATLLGVGLVLISGANYLAMHHLEKAIALSPNNIEYKKAILYYYIVPESPLSRDRARFYAKEVLEAEPENSRALEILDSVKWRNEKAKEAQKILENLGNYEIKTKESDYYWGYREVYDKSSNEIWLFSPDLCFEKYYKINHRGSI